MSILKSLVGWIGRNFILFILIIAALLLHQFLKPSYDSYNQLKVQVAQLQAGSEVLKQDSRDLAARTTATIATAQGASEAAISRRITAAKAERARLERAMSSDLAALLRKGPEEVVANQKRRVRVALLTREIQSLTTLKTSMGARRVGESLPQAVRRHTGVMRAEAANMRRVGAELTEIQNESAWTRAFNTEDEERLARRFKTSQDQAAAAARAAERLINGRQQLKRSEALARRSAANAQAELDKLISDRSKELSGNLMERLRAWAERAQLGDKAKLAAFILLGVILSPFLIRTIFYFVLAPIAQRRPPVRLLEKRRTAGPVTTAGASATSLSIRLQPGEELLVRQGFLQSSSKGGAKATRWLLDYRHPLSSLAAGLSFLTRIGDEVEDVTTVSAVEDPFAEVALVVLPEAAACVLQPRALVAVIQPTAQSVRITSHWRLTSLNPWLTLQLRFLVFHGPAQLVLRGGRGVRVEHAKSGRMFGQDQLLGFNADLAYSVTRTETFAPYFFGRESLLKDQVVGHDGVLILEEAPMAGRRAKGVRGGLEGVLDVMLKTVGV